jgi:hypothetical protein
MSCLPFPHYDVSAYNNNNHTLNSLPKVEFDKEEEDVHRHVQRGPSARWNKLGILAHLIQADLAHIHLARAPHHLSCDKRAEQLGCLFVSLLRWTVVKLTQTAQDATNVNGKVYGSSSLASNLKNG